MPTQRNSMPTTWNKIKDGEFYIINGQHNIAASRKMMEANSKQWTKREADAYMMIWVQAQKEQRSQKKGEEHIIIQEEEQLPLEDGILKSLWSK